MNNEQNENVYKTFQYFGKTVVLCTTVNDRGTYGYANFAGTGCALAGVLKQNETLEKWIKRAKKSSK